MRKRWPPLVKLWGLQGEIPKSTYTHLSTTYESGDDGSETWNFEYQALLPLDIVGVRAGSVPATIMFESAKILSPSDSISIHLNLHRLFFWHQEGGWWGRFFDDIRKLDGPPKILENVPKMFVDEFLDKLSAEVFRTHGG